MRNFWKPGALIFLYTLLIGWGISSSPLTAQTEVEEAAALAEKLKQVPAYWEDKVEFFTLEEYEQTLEYWSRTYSDRCQLERRGVTNDGFRFYMLRITESSIPDEDKQVCLITALHGGPERTGTTTVLKLAEWLLGNSPEAKLTPGAPDRTHAGNAPPGDYLLPIASAIRLLSILTRVGQLRMGSR
ncbi:MAG: hypothetical protein R3C11_29165 [Planctomycetaceae bacterium]